MGSSNPDENADRAVTDPLAASMELLKSLDVELTDSAESLKRPDAKEENSATKAELKSSGSGTLKVSISAATESGEQAYKEKQKQRRDSIPDHHAQMRQHALEKAAQENELRSKFFSVAIAMAIFVLICSNAGILVYLAQTNGTASHVVLSAWLVSVVAEVIAILHIIAKYLFPAPKAD